MENSVKFRNCPAAVINKWLTAIYFESEYSLDVIL